MAMFLAGIGLPALAAAVVLAAGRRAWGERGGRQAAALAIGLGYLAGHAVVAGFAWPPLEAIDRVPWLVLGAVALGLLDATWPVPVWAALENRVLLAAATVAAILGPTVQETWTVPAVLLRLAALGAGVVLAWSSMEALARRLDGWALALPLLLTAAGLALVIVPAGSLNFGRLAVALAAALGGCALASSFGPPVSMTRGAVPAVVVVLASLLLVGLDYVSAPWPRLLALAAAPSAAWVARLGPLGRLGGWKRALVAAAAVLVPVGIVAALSLAEIPVDEY